MSETERRDRDDTVIPEDDRKRLQAFSFHMMRYKCAVKLLTTKFEILNEELSQKSGRNPIDNIISRVKTPDSIADKLRRRGLPLTDESIEKNLNDVAGVRIICPFVDDIYSVAEMLARQDDVRVIEVEDYIKKPKLNGYRSYHMVVEVPVYFADATYATRAEIQFRTVAMDFWATLEHMMKYKNDHASRPEIENELKSCAEVIAATDARMLGIRRRIDGMGSDGSGSGKPGTGESGRGPAEPGAPALS